MDALELLEHSPIVVREIVGNLGAVGEIDVVVCDSRSVVHRSMFCCVRGRTTDGHLFADQAIDHGAVALVVDHRLDLDFPQVVVDDTRVAAGVFASTCCGDPSQTLRVVGVTGTNGKTTTTYVIEAILRAAGGTVGVIGTIGTRFADRVEVASHTTPDQCRLQSTLASMRAAGVTDVAMEVSSHALDQQRVAGTKFAVACFTNLRIDHLDYHGGVQEYGEAKAALFEPRYTSCAVVNFDDEFGRTLHDRATRAGLDVWTYGIADGGVTNVSVAETDVSADRIELSPRGTTFAVHGARVVAPFVASVPLVGAFNVSNALCAVTMALAMGIDTETIIEGLRTVTHVPGRLERVSELSDRFSVFVDYAHTADALEAVIAAVRPFAAGARVCVVYGCGGDRDASKRPAMAAAVADGADVAVLTSDNPRSEDPAAIVEDALAGISNGARKPHVELDRRAAIAWMIDEARPGDVVVIAGKGHESGQTVGSIVLPFDDRAVTRELLAAHR